MPINFDLFKFPLTNLAQYKETRERRRLERAIRKNGNVTLVELDAAFDKKDASLDVIGANLREIYRSVVIESIPKKFVSVLHDLEVATA